MNKPAQIYWNDVMSYYDNKFHHPTKAYTEGLIVKEEKYFVVVQDPETVLFSESGTRNHPLTKPKYYYIPKSLIQEIKYK